jgi:HEAT repeat protein
MREAVSADTRNRIKTHIANLGSPDQARALQAESRLIRFGSKAVPLLLEAAASPDPQVRFRVVWALGKSRDARALESIFRMTSDTDERVRYDAATALGEYGDTSAVPVLSRLAESAADSDLGSAARAALRKLGIEASALP